MQTRNRRPQDRPLAGVVPEQARRIEERSPLQDRADELLRAADDALKDVLSKDAGKFIEDSRQQGGQ
jgi:hypothetical protein